MPEAMKPRTIEIAPFSFVRDSSRPDLGELRFIAWQGGFRGERIAKCCRFDGQRVMVRQKKLEFVRRERKESQNET